MCATIIYCLMAFCGLMAVVTFIHEAVLTRYNARDGHAVSYSRSIVWVFPIVVLLFSNVDLQLGEAKITLSKVVCNLSGDPQGTILEPDVASAPPCPVARLYDQIRISFHKERAADETRLEAALKKCNIQFVSEQGVANNIGGYNRPAFDNNRVSFNSKGRDFAWDASFQKLIVNAVGATQIDIDENTSETAEKGSVQVNLFKKL